MSRVDYQPSRWQPTTIMTQVDLKISFWSLESYLIEYNQMLSNIIETYPV